MIRDFRLELQAFFASCDQHLDQDTAKSDSLMQNQKLKLSALFMRRLKDADSADVEDWYNFGRANFFGYETERDVETAAFWYRLAANAGHAKAMVGLALCLETSDDASAFKKAMKWYRKAAALGNADALKYLAFAFRDGKGVPVDVEEGRRLMHLWFNRVSLESASQ